MKFVNSLFFVLRIYRILPDANGSGFGNTLFHVFIPLPALFILTTNVFWMYANFSTASLPKLLLSVRTAIFCLGPTSSHIIMVFTKLQLRDVLDEMERLWQTSNKRLYIYFQFFWLLIIYKTIFTQEDASEHYMRSIIT